jgi:hypothetical protein
MTMKRQILLASILAVIGSAGPLCAQNTLQKSITLTASDGTRVVLRAPSGGGTYDLTLPNSNGSLAASGAQGRTVVSKINLAGFISVINLAAGNESILDVDNDNTVYTFTGLSNLVIGRIAGGTDGRVIRIVNMALSNSVTIRPNFGAAVGSAIVSGYRPVSTVDVATTLGSGNLSLASSSQDIALPGIYGPPTPSGTVDIPDANDVASTAPANVTSNLTADLVTGDVTGLIDVIPSSASGVAASGTYNVSLSSLDINVSGSTVDVVSPTQMGIDFSSVSVSNTATVNRAVNTEDIVLLPYGSIELMYDAVADAWVVLSVVN